MKNLFRLIILLVILVVIPVPLAQAATLPGMSFEPATVTASEGDVFTTQVIVDTAGVSAEGAGARISYNPLIMKVLDIQPGTIFADYPLAAFDNSTGQIAVSGIVSGPGEAFTGRDVLATITWRLLQSNGTQAFFDFEPGSTTDSNIAVTKGNGDILDHVDPLIVQIGTSSVVQPSPKVGAINDTIVPPITTTTTPTAEPGPLAFITQPLSGYLKEGWLWPKNIFKQIKSKITSLLPTQLQPYEPISDLNTQTELKTTQDPAKVVVVDGAIPTSVTNTNNPGTLTATPKNQVSLLPFILLALGLGVGCLVIFWWWKR